jgi:membrane associated rhomboid family serine protease
MRATNVLILICIAVTLYALYGADPTSVERNLVFSLKNMQEGRVWTPITAIFVHASLIHLLGNVIFRYVFGNTLESVTNSKRMLTVFSLEASLAFHLAFPSFSLMLPSSARQRQYSL